MTGGWALSDANHMSDRSVSAEFLSYASARRRSSTRLRSQRRQRAATKGGRAKDNGKSSYITRQTRRGVPFPFLKGGVPFAAWTRLKFARLPRGDQVPRTLAQPWPLWACGFGESIAAAIQQPNCLPILGAVSITTLTTAVRFAHATKKSLLPIVTPHATRLCLGGLASSRSLIRWPRLLHLHWSA